MIRIGVSDNVRVKASLSGHCLGLGLTYQTIAVHIGTSHQLKDDAAGGRSVKDDAAGGRGKVGFTIKR